MVFMQLGKDMGFGGFAFALKLPEWLNTNLVTVRANIFFPKWAPNLVPSREMNLGAQLGPMSIANSSTNWACQMGPIHFPKICCLGYMHARLHTCIQRYRPYIHSCIHKVRHAIFGQF